ncbi:14629_t:CDS:2 [Dentiscutata erythropus]|uniref:14629_t:CDS:1 n=1 Tax=Dentiscutata erythropus TaxID=1348616 RepID=A0A9N9CCM7_9GLOM|nr:14629_t:CDS:2 [Dentiscutata erythropus]
MTTYEQVQKKKIPIIPYENFEELKDDTSNNAPIFAFDNKKVTLKLLVNEKCDKQGIKKLLLELRQFDHENILKTYGLTKVPKLTSIGVSKINTPDGFPFTPYKPPELLTSQQLNKQKDGTKLNIFSLGVLFWEVSNNGNPPFNNRFDITLVVKVIDGFRESPIKGTPNKYVEIYIKCWDGNPDERPSCNDILEELKEISYEDVDKNLVQEQDRVPDPEDTPLSPDITPDDAFDLNTEHLLDFDFLEQERERKKVFVKRFGLTKGRNRDGYDFVPGAKHILDDNGTFNTEKIEHFTPIVYLAKVNTEPWGFLNKFTLFPRKDKKVPYGVDFIRIHIPVADVEYEGHLTDEFIHEIKDALEILDNQEKRTKLKEIFTEYGNYIITKFTIGGAIMIDAHDIDDESLLRFQVYLKWGINFAKGETHAIFENGLLEGFPRFETFPSRPMDNVKDLYTWLKNLHDCQDVELILYKSYKPFYELLDNNFKDLKEKIFECFSLNSFNPADELPILIPQLPPEFEQETFSEWTSSSKSSLLPYVRDWIEELSLRYGVLLQHSKLEYGNKKAFKFLREPEITRINKLIVLLVQPNNQQDAYLLDNGIDLKMADKLRIGETPFTDFKSPLNYPVEDLRTTKNKSSKKVFCQIIYQAARLSFDLPYIKASEPYIEEVDKAIESHQPYKELSELFNRYYGHILPKTIVIGGILKRSYESYKINSVKTSKIEIDINTSQEEIENRLVELSEKYNIDTSLFLSHCGQVIDQDQIEDWWKSLKDSPEKWKIISFEDWEPSYKVLDQSCSDVEVVLDDKCHIVFEGENFLTLDNQLSVIIDFPGPISESDKSCQVYGEIVKKVISDKNEYWETVPNVTITFDYISKSGCVALIHNNSGISLNKDETKILWFVLAKLKGYSELNYRDIKVIYGEREIDDIQSDIVLKTDEEIYADNVLVTSLVPKPFKDISNYKIVLKNWAKNTIILGIEREGQENSQESSGQVSDEDLEESSDDAKEEPIEISSEPNPQEKIILNYCIINADEKKVDKACNWNIYGINLDEDLKNDDINYHYDPSYSPMTLEEAIEQHKKPNGNTLDAWKSFIKIRNDSGDPKATYWIGYYLENNKKILNASTQFYKDVLEETKEPLQQAAMRYYKEAADYGDSNGLLSYGYCLFSGKGVLQDKLEAKRYFELSSQKGNVDAMYNLGGILYMDGHTERGKMWLTKAAQSGHPTSIKFCRARNISF